MNGSENRNHPGAPKAMRLWFGIFMVLIYIGVGLLFFFDVFSIDNNAISYTVAPCSSSTASSADTACTKAAIDRPLSFPSGASGLLPPHTPK